MNIKGQGHRKVHSNLLQCHVTDGFQRS